ncbi:MAG: tryptophan synthase subunit alpha [Betaproteobacteria bacterium]|nr:MAG: tryptophan synthase subunit alpha [Betaproteobacteria bacterium]TAG46518.1 MAG: tryptophan synthase subunit alpha [Betaproteobacteria bacterium]TAG76874.1 MAG: tryptophan synthase subunit alpha [Betaproteobacteria bacterium]
MNRINTTFSALKSSRKTALIPFITAGDPTLDSTLPTMHALAKAGADVIELGVPFSDPMADGPVIQRSSERALMKGMSLRKVLAIVAEFRKDNATTPVVLMGYANPIEAMGREVFVAAAASAGVDGVLVVDYPPEEADDFSAVLIARDLAPIFLLAPTSSAERVQAVGRLARGYVYYVSLRGVTGAGNLDVADVASKVAAIKAIVSVPVGVGFGIRDAATARAVGAVADAVVIGSALVQTMFDAPESEIAQTGGAWLAKVREALDQ